MDLRKILAVTGKPGLYKLQKENKNSLIVKSLETGRNQAISMQRNNFTVLETVEVYTTDEDDTTSLPDVIREMFKLDEAGTSTPDIKTISEDDLRAYFQQVLENHDEERVYISHIKKIVKWYDLLKKNNMVDLEIVEPEEEETEKEANSEEKAD